MSCPLCRSEFDKLFTPQIDKNMQNEIQANILPEYEERKMQLLKDGDWVADMKQVFFALGNTAEKYKDPQAGANI